jgi:hypothetical protein
MSAENGHINIKLGKYLTNKFNQILREKRKTYPLLSYSEYVKQLIIADLKYHKYI